MSLKVTTGENQSVQDTGGVTRVSPGGEAQQLPAGQQSESKPRPEGLPEEFGSLDEFVAKYNELKNGKAPVTDDAGQTPPADQQQQQQQQTDADPRFAPYTDEYARTGTLSAESKAKAAKEFGVTLAEVDVYLAGMGAAGNQAKAAAVPFFDAFGGEASYAKFQEWAGAGNIPANEIAAFNALLDTNPTAALVMAREFKGRWNAAGNQAPRDITAGSETVVTSAPRGFQSVGEMKAAMADPRYEKDAAYRKEVEAKVAAAKF